MSISWFLASVVLLCASHFIRVLRWELFISVYEQPKRRNLIQAVVAGYAVNFIIPFKIGDLVRALIAGKKMNNGISFGFATVFVDRYIDILVVGIMFGVLSAIGKASIGDVLLYIVLAAGIAVFTAICILWNGLAKKAIRYVARVFNQRIELTLLQFFWALIVNLKNLLVKISKKRILVYTVTMWAGYLASYYSFARFLSALGGNVTWLSVFGALFGDTGLQLSTHHIINATLSANVNYGSFMALYMLAPLCLLAVISFALPEKNDSLQESRYQLLPHLDQKERREFLEAYFSNQNREYIIHYLEINQKVSVLRDYSAGSSATTILCTDGSSTFFRKFAFGVVGAKLNDQYCWIQKYQTMLPLPKVLSYEKTDNHFCYDMPYLSNAVSLFEYAHSMPVDMTWEIIKRVLTVLEETIYKIGTYRPDSETIEKYIKQKVDKNIWTIRNCRAIKTLLKYDELIINGTSYKNLDYYEEMIQSKNLQKVFEQDICSAIHGDLTIENIICIRETDGKDNFYIIDPNTGNILDSEYLDYGKLLQSLHGGYEFLMASKELSVTGNRIDFIYTKSTVYEELHNRLKKYMISHLGEEATRSAYFHEIVHWIRLLPYKIEKDERKAILFFAGLLKVMNDVDMIYEDK